MMWLGGAALIAFLVFGKDGLSKLKKLIPSRTSPSDSPILEGAEIIEHAQALERCFIACNDDECLEMVQKIILKHFAGEKKAED